MEKLLEVLKQGGIILYPTDTIWGLGCDAANPEAIQKLFSLKKKRTRKIGDYSGGKRTKTAENSRGASHGMGNHRFERKACNHRL